MASVFPKAAKNAVNAVCGNATFWAHLIEAQEDYNRHLDYIHWNPVKHGYAKSGLPLKPGHLTISKG